MSLVDQLWEIYELETWHQTRLAKEEADKYHQQLLEQGNIITCSGGGKLLGYVEFWRINYEQFGRIICGDGFAAICEDVVHGHIAYVANTFIQPEARQKEVYKMLRDRFFEVNKMCTHFVGNARRKKSEPVKVFKRKVEV